MTTETDTAEDQGTRGAAALPLEGIHSLEWWAPRLNCASVRELLILCKARGIAVVEWSRKRRCLLAEDVLAVARGRRVLLGEGTRVGRPRTEDGTFGKAESGKRKAERSL